MKYSELPRPQHFQGGDFRTENTEMIYELEKVIS